MTVATDALRENFSLIALVDAEGNPFVTTNPADQQRFPEVNFSARKSRIECGRLCIALALSLMAHFALAYLSDDFFPAPPAPSTNQLIVYLDSSQASPPSTFAKDTHPVESSPIQKQPANAAPEEKPAPDAVTPQHEMQAANTVLETPPAETSESLAIDRPEPAQSSRKTGTRRPAEKNTVAQPTKPAPPVQTAKPAPATKKRPLNNSKSPPSPSSTPEPSTQLRPTDQSTTARAAQGQTAKHNTVKSKQANRSVKAAPLPDNPKPRYPLVARRRGVEGRVILQVTVMTNGSAAHVKVKTGSGHAQLDRAALEAVRRWRFRPAQQGGQPISAVVDVPIVFRLNG
ncbi:MAG: energy transducer TonB [Candidatus Competibacteraceae bacterium]|nr:energy transducer TonB [Candidatus Competibacteraceae bacterium]